MRRLAIALIMTCLAGAACGHEYRVGGIAIGHPFTRATLPGAATAAAYATLTNEGPEGSRLVSASSPVATRIEIHESVIDQGVARMRKLESGVELPAGGMVELAPRSLHLMLSGLKAPFREGDRVPLLLVFEPEGSISVELAVEPLRPEDKGLHSGH